MAIEKVQITVSAIVELLQNGYTWFKKDDLGYGSIQEKFQAADTHIHAIRKHPLLKDLETSARVFVIIDDTKEQTDVRNTTTVSSNNGGDEKDLGTLPELKQDLTFGTTTDQSDDCNRSSESGNEEVNADSAAAFADL
jgi:hypothetical protein